MATVAGLINSGRLRKEKKLRVTIIFLVQQVKYVSVHLSYPLGKQEKDIQGYQDKFMGKIKLSNR